jgi:sulfur-carrier protein
VAVVRLFASAREAAGTARAEIAGNTVAEVLAAATDAYGPHFAAVLATCRIWVNGEPADPDALVSGRDEVAVLPPVSGG